jgi:hypothetical protein
MFLTHVGEKANDAEEETMQVTCLYHECNQSIQVIDGVTVMSLSASLLQKISVATDRLCQVALNRKLTPKFQKWCKFSSRVEVKLHKVDHVK